jgi:Protein of unknown function (DUF3489)/Homeodomain-like domain
MEGTALSSADYRRPPRETKRAQVLAMLSRPEGASGPRIAEAMGWAPHTVRGLLAGLAKKVAGCEFQAPQKGLRLINVNAISFMP